MASQDQRTERPREDIDQQGELVEGTSEQDVEPTIQDTMLVRTAIQASKHRLQNMGLPVSSYLENQQRSTLLCLPPELRQCI
jgi:hypothetical protein